MRETERMIKPGLACEPGDRGEGHNNACNGNAERFQYVALFVMANLVCKHGFQFEVGELGDKRI